MPKTEASVLDPFIHHGLKLKAQGSQSTTECPFCSSEGKFHVANKTGQWDCKVCGRSGNVYKFLELLHGSYLDNTKPETYKEIAEFRGLPPAAFRNSGLAVDWTYLYLPIRNANGTTVQLRSYDFAAGKEWQEWKKAGSKENAKPASKKPQWHNTKGLGVYLYGLEDLPSSHPSTPIYICEGEWDAIALRWLLDKLKKRGVVLAVPGANTFRQEWVPLFKHRDVILLYDNDAAGDDGMERASALLRGHVRTLRQIQWPEEFNKGCDLNDLISSRGVKQAKATFDLINRLIYTAKTPSTPPATSSTSKTHGKPITFTRVVQEFRKFVHVTKRFEHAIAITLATINSTHLPDDPLWAFLVGPPGSGKSLLLRSLGSSPHCVFKSRITAKSLISGWQPDDGSDPSLLNQISGKTLVIKDFTAVHSMPLIEKESLYGVLRDAYDGEVEQSFATGITRHYECHFSIVAGVTSVIHGDSRTTLGERFIKYEILPHDYNPREQTRRAMDNAAKRISAEKLLHDIMQAYTSQPFHLNKVPRLTAEYKERLLALAQLVAFLRAGVDRSHTNEPAYRPTIEIPTRLVKQLVKLTQCLAYVYGQTTITESVYKIVEEVAFNTATGWGLDVIRHLVKTYPEPVTTDSLHLITQVPKTTLYRKLEDLHNLGLVRVVTIPRDKGRGHKAHGYVLEADVLAVWKAAKVSKGLASHD